MPSTYEQRRSIPIGLTLASGLALVSALPSAARADEEPTPAHVHVPLEVDPALGWDELIASALAAHPRSGELVARESEAAAWSARGKNWIAAAPSLYFSYLSDGPLDDYGQREYDGGVELPLWRAGQRSAVQQVAASASAESAAAAAALRLEIAGLLRGVLWDVETTANELAAARDVAIASGELVRVVERRNSRGDLPLADVLLARADLLDKQQAVVAREAELVDAERTYRTLTSLDHRPAAFAERRAPDQELGTGHPLLALADAEVARARSTLDLIDRETRGNVTVMVGPHRQRDPLTDFYVDSVSVGVKIPVGGSSHGVTQRAQSARLVADAEARRAALARRLDRDLHEAEHTLAVIAESLVLATERRDLAIRQSQMARTAFEQGEIELRELLRVQQTAQVAERDVRRLGIERQRTVSAFNQAIGVTP